MQASETDNVSKLVYLTAFALALAASALLAGGAL